MLVLSRRVGERIKIGDGVWLTVVSAEKGKVRLGFDADRDVPIHREEVSGQVYGKPIALKPQQR